MGTVLTPALPVSLDFSLFYSTLFFFSFSSDKGRRTAYPSTYKGFCFLSHLLVEFYMMSSPLTWRHSWTPLGEGRVSGLTHQASFCTVDISSGLSHVVALWQHAVGGKNAFPPQVILGTCWWKTEYPWEPGGKKVPGFDCNGKGASFLHKQIEERIPGFSGKQ